MARFLQIASCFTVLASGVLAIVLPTPQSSETHSSNTAIVTVPPELRRRQEYGPGTCGYNEFESLTCATASETCAGTRMPNGQLYEYCATNGAFIHEVWTAGYAYGEAPGSCSPNDLCCDEEYPDLSINLFVTSGSTWTNWQCWTSVAINTWTAAHALLAPSRAGGALGNSATSTASSSSTGSPNMSKSGPHKHTASSSSTPGAGSDDPSDLTMSDEIALGIGIPGSIAGIICCWIAWKTYKKKYKTPKLATPGYQEIQFQSLGGSETRWSRM